MVLKYLHWVDPFENHLSARDTSIYMHYDNSDMSGIGLSLKNMLLFKREWDGAPDPMSPRPIWQSWPSKDRFHHADEGHHRGNHRS